MSCSNSLTLLSAAAIRVFDGNRIIILASLTDLGRFRLEGGEGSDHGARGSDVLFQQSDFAFRGSDPGGQLLDLVLLVSLGGV